MRSFSHAAAISAALFGFDMARASSSPIRRDADQARPETARQRNARLAVEGDPYQRVDKDGFVTAIGSSRGRTGAAARLAEQMAAFAGTHIGKRQACGRATSNRYLHGEKRQARGSRRGKVRAAFRAPNKADAA